MIGGNEHMTRVVTERAELERKLAALRIFLNGETFTMLSAQEKDLLLQQEQIMAAYSGILGRRMSLTTEPRG